MLFVLNVLVLLISIAILISHAPDVLNGETKVERVTALSSALYKIAVIIIIVNGLLNGIY